MAERTNLKILEIDDNLDTMQAVKALLARKLPGVSVFAADSGAKGLDLAAAENPDVILLDIIMPGMDGFEVCRRLKADDRLRAIPVVFVTADKIDKESRIKAIEVGADGFLRKPFEVEELVASIRTMVKIKADAAAQGEEAERLRDLGKAFPQSRSLSRLLPICVSCKKIYSEKGSWEEVDQYFKEHMNIHFTHGCCPDCAQKLYPEYMD